MKRLGLVILLLVLNGIAPGEAFADQAKYISGIEDLPLMPGLKQSPVSLPDFKHLFTRSVNSTAKGDVSTQAVNEYYAETLPEHGWVKVTPVEYRRGNEDLDIAVRSSHMTGAMVHFSLTQAKAAN